MARITVSIPDELRERLNLYKGMFNISAVCAAALETELDGLPQLAALRAAAAKQCGIPEHILFAADASPELIAHFNSLWSAPKERWLCTDANAWLHESGWSVTSHETGLETVWWAHKPDSGVFENQSWGTAAEARVWVEEQLFSDMWVVRHG